MLHILNRWGQLSLRWWPVNRHFLQNRTAGGSWMTCDFFTFSIFVFDERISWIEISTGARFQFVERLVHFFWKFSTVVAEKETLHPRLFKYLIFAASAADMLFLSTIALKTNEIFPYWKNSAYDYIFLPNIERKTRLAIYDLLLI